MHAMACCKQTKKEEMSNIRNNEKAMQFIRFGVNGVFVTAIQYAVYLLLKQYMGVNAAYTVGYLVSFCVNFFMTSYFTFRSKPSLKRFVGFSGSHVVNYLVQIGLLNLFLWIGVGSNVAPIPAMAGAVVVQFTILRLVYGKSK